MCDEDDSQIFFLLCVRDLVEMAPIPFLKNQILHIINSASCNIFLSGFCREPPKTFLTLSA